MLKYPSNAGMSYIISYLDNGLGVTSKTFVYRYTYRSSTNKTPEYLSNIKAYVYIVYSTPLSNCYLFNTCTYTYTFNSCNMGMSVLPDMYTQIPRAACPRDEGVHIRQNTSAQAPWPHFIYI